MSSVGFILLLIGIFRKDSRFYKAALACVGFDIFACVISVVITKLMGIM